ncbi:DUF4190 domain-containing protein [Cellulomonas bogoriensis]|uniref:DUF4190 domain-containing protein n=1 Tax=Cellulomonas bogoriensis 69B4 = DSM 16987 TaxID=1386082 RepID=A0A0A0BTW8_9CELL|nr:DUF4190 domain-containing protein [Cellulomonas bogoriensis]KGM11132.1 hypothetical protein N869_03640 [Cellulomonas bogoriensis 69B4 = DSM 16987]
MTQPTDGTSRPAPVRTRRNPNSLADTALVLGIVAVLLSWLPFVGLLGVVGGAVGAVVGTRALRRARDKGYGGLGTARSGIVLGAVAVVLGLASTTVGVWYFTTTEAPPLVVEPGDPSDLAGDEMGPNDGDPLGPLDGLVRPDADDLPAEATDEVATNPITAEPLATMFTRTGMPLRLDHVALDPRAVDTTREREGDDGAAATAVLALAAWRHTYVTGDDTLMRSLVDPDCVWCDHAAASAVADPLAPEDGRYLIMSVAPLRIETQTAGTEAARVLIALESSVVEVTDEDGVPHVSATEPHRMAYTVALEQQEDRWTVTGVGREEWTPAHGGER